MKDPSVRSKVVIRHLPPSLTQPDLCILIDEKFSGRYNWFSFRPGKNSQKHQRYSRAYIDFKKPGDVFEFAQSFDGHVFVNEKGAQCKIVVEYAPSQRVSKRSTKKDGREGTIYKDPDYLEFLKTIAKPAEHLPSAEIQLERREAEQAGSAKENPVVTPLMEYVRQKRAAESGAQGSSVVGKIRRRSRVATSGKPGSSTTKRDSEKKKYILKEGAKTTAKKDKSTFTVVARREDQPITSSGKKISENVTDSGKKILLLKGKERGVSREQQVVTSVAGNSSTSTASKENQRREGGERVIKSILLNNESHQSQSSTAVQPQQKIQILRSESGKRPPRDISARLGPNGLVSQGEPNSFGSEGDTKRTREDKFTKRIMQVLGNVSEKQEKRTRNRDRPDRGVWTPLHRSDVSHSSDDRLSSPVSHPTQSLADSVEASHREMKDVPYGSRTAEVTAPTSGRNTSVANGSHRRVDRRGAVHIMKDDGSLNTSEGKSSRRGGVSGHGALEKQMWIQKSSSVMAFSKCTNSSLSKDYMLLQSEASIKDIMRSKQAQNGDSMIVPIVGPTMLVEVSCGTVTRVTPKEMQLAYSDECRPNISDDKIPKLERGFAFFTMSLFRQKIYGTRMACQICFTFTM